MTGGTTRALGRAVPYALILASVSCFQYGAALAKPLFAVIGAQGASALRLGLAALILSAIMRPWRFALTGRVKWLLLGYGAALAGLNLFFFMAIRTIPLGLAVALEFSGPLLLAFADLAASGRPSVGRPRRMRGRAFDAVHRARREP